MWRVPMPAISKAIARQLTSFPQGVCLAEITGSPAGCDDLGRVDETPNHVMHWLAGQLK
jgi:hypothetical protein